MKQFFASVSACLIFSAGLVEAQSPTVAYWRFEGASATDVIDASSNGNTGALVNGAVRSSNVPVPLVPQTLARNMKSLSLDGINDAVVVPDSPSLRPATAITIEMWLRPTGSAWVAIGKQLGGCCANSFQIELSPSGITFQLTDTTGTPSFASSTKPPTWDSWQHVAATWDGAMMRIYLNSVEVGSTAFSGPIGYDTNEVIIGADNDGGGVPGCCFYMGDIDEVRISNVALMPSQFLSELPCPVTTALAEPALSDTQRLSILDDIYRFRNTVMARNAPGRYYIGLFYSFAQEGSRILERKPGLRAQTLDVLHRIQPVIAAAAEGRPTFLTGSDILAVETLMDRFYDEASPSLKLAIRYIRYQFRSGKLLSSLGS